jgi:mono/diheme cytochrome c family protein
MSHRWLRRTPPLAATALMALALGGGCDKKATESGPPPAAVSGKGPAGASGTDSPGLAVFRGRGCANCHSTPQTGPARGKFPGPDLAHVASAEGHTREWLMGYVRDPHGQNPQAKMPAFGSKLTEEELNGVADFLVTLK